MDPSREPFLRRFQQSILPSGQAYYTLESLEGATSLPFLNPALPASLPRRESFPPPRALERDAILRMDAQTRALLDLAAEREALLRSLPGRATALPDQRINAGGLQALDARARVSLDGLQNLDPRARGGQELGVGAPFLTAAGPTLGRRERDIWHAEVLDVGAQSARLFANGSREPAATRSEPAEANKVKNQADKKRASDEKPETLQSAKCLKASTPVVTSNAPTAVATDVPSHQYCEICNISTTEETLEEHLKGKRHAGRVRWNLKRNLKKNLRILRLLSRQPPSF